MLTVGDHVLGTERATVEVKWVCRHPHGEEEIVVLKTPSTQLRVTNSHRILKKGDYGEKEVRAGDLQNGDWIIVGQRPEQVSVQREFMQTSPIEIGFENDASVEAWSAPDHGIVTKGQEVVQLHAAHHCKEEDEEEDVASEMHQNFHDLNFTRGRRSRRSRQRHDRAMQEIRRARSPCHEFE